MTKPTRPPPPKALLTFHSLFKTTLSRACGVLTLTAMPAVATAARRPYSNISDESGAGVILLLACAMPVAIFFWHWGKRPARLTPSLLTLAFFAVAAHVAAFAAVWLLQRLSLPLWACWLAFAAVAYGGCYCFMHPAQWLSDDDL